MFPRCLPTVLFALLANVPAGGQALAGGESKARADPVTDGEAHAALRYRYEYVDQDGFDEDARASTVRLRLNFLTPAWRGWSAFGEFDYVGELFFDEFNSGGGTSPERTQYPVVADPEGADLNQVYADYRTKEWRLRFGRQRILLDDQRFVGGVGWRQNEQTFDSISIAGNALGAAVFYAWVGNTNRIFGDRVPAGDHRMNTHLLNVGISVGGGSKITPYVYYIDDEDEPGLSTSTLGLRIDGARETAAGRFSWLAEYARQFDAANAPVRFDASYLHLDVHWSPADSWPSAGLGIASLEGDSTTPGTSFRTPLATLHAFQGWADQFLLTPDTGVVDGYGSVHYASKSWEWEAVYHHFSPEDGGGSFGRELDFSVARPFGDRYVLTLLAAFFEGRTSEFPDATKAWLMLTAAW
jgi:hypothetical protein